MFRSSQGFLTLQLLVDRYLINKRLTFDKPNEDIVSKFCHGYRIQEQVLNAYFPYIIPLMNNESSEIWTDMRNFLEGENYVPQSVYLPPFPTRNYISFYLLNNS